MTGEHGIGKLKLRILEGLLPQQHIDLCTELKAEMDAVNVWNRGNIINGEAGSR